MRIFVSYRRADSAGWTGRLVEDLSKRFGKANVFFDIISVEPGVDFVADIKKTLEKTQRTLVVIGPEWLGIKGETGNRRLDNEDDLVRHEVALALQSRSPVIPVLVGGAKMPAEATLPDDIRLLARRNAAEVTDHRWAADVSGLITVLAGKVWWQRIVMATLGFVQISFVLVWVYQISLESRISGDQAKSATLRDRYTEKMRNGSDECMAGAWPDGAIRGKTYHENGNMVTDDCKGVSAELNYFQQFFNNEQLWRMPPSLDSAARFAAIYQKIFEGDFAPTLKSLFSFPLNATALELAEKVRQDVALKAREVLTLKQGAGEAAERLQGVQQATFVGLIWTIIIGLAIILWFARGAINLKLRAKETN